MNNKYLVIYEWKSKYYSDITFVLRSKILHHFILLQFII